MKNKKYFSIFFVISLLLFGLFGCNSNEEKQKKMGELKITFHDAPLQKDDISRIDMVVLETQVINAYDEKIVISNAPVTFNLLDLTVNNPVALAHTTIAPGIYKQIRLILDENGTTVTLKDGTIHPLRVPSGEQTGVKLDGFFEIPAGRLYTLDIDMDPGQSVHYTEGNGYMLKPVVELTGSDVLAGNFYFGGNVGGQSYVFDFNADGSMKLKTSKYKKYVIKGSYYHDGAKQQITIKPKKVTCPSCNPVKKYAVEHHAKVPKPTTYDVISFGADYVRIRPLGGGDENILERVDSFSLRNDVATEDFEVSVTNVDANWSGNILYGQLVPKNGMGNLYSSVSYVDGNSTTALLDFSIARVDLKNDRMDYNLLIGVVDSNATFEVMPGSNEIRFEYEKLIARNNRNPFPLTVYWGDMPTTPIEAYFDYNTTN